MKHVFEAVDGNYRLRIYPDPEPYNPRDEHNLGTMVCSHRRYNLGDEQAENLDFYSGWEEWLENEILKPHKGEVVYLPLYIYDHGGITMNTTGFSCPWDSGQVGWIYCAKQRLLAETGYTEKELFNKDPHRKPEVGELVKVNGCKGWGQIKMLADSHATIDFDHNKIPSARRPENLVVVPLSQIIEVMANMAENILRNEVQEYNDYLTGRVFAYSFAEKIDGEWVETESEFGLLGSWIKEALADQLQDKQHLAANFIA